LTAAQGLGQMDDVTSDLVGYVIIEVPDVAALTTLTPALAKLVESGLLRVLDLVVVARAEDGAVRVLEVAALEKILDLNGIAPDITGLLTERDISLAAVAIPPGTAGVVLVTEDRWATPLSSAAGRVGGQIVAGERIPSARVQAALADKTSRDRGD